MHEQGAHAHFAAPCWTDMPSTTWVCWHVFVYFHFQHVEFCVSIKSYRLGCLQLVGTCLSELVLVIGCAVILIMFMPDKHRCLGSRGYYVNRNLYLPDKHLWTALRCCLGTMWFAVIYETMKWTFQATMCCCMLLLFLHIMFFPNFSSLR
jgi:hypothetical protein